MSVEQMKERGKEEMNEYVWGGRLRYLKGRDKSKRDGVVGLGYGIRGL